MQLDVKGCKDIYASFDKYCEVEVLEGDNQYNAEKHGMQVGRGRAAGCSSAAKDSSGAVREESPLPQPVITWHTSCTHD